MALTKGPASAAVCFEFELREGKRPALADMEALKQRARELAQEARAQAAAEHPGAPLPRDTITEDILPTEVCALLLP